MTEKTVTLLPSFR